MLLKPGVDISHVCREIRRKFPAINAAFPDFVVSSTRHDVHSDGSLHYSDEAIDTRLVYPVKWAEIDPVKLSMIMGPGFDVLRSTSCYHIEWDPKPGEGGG